MPERTATGTAERFADAVGDVDGRIWLDAAHRGRLERSEHEADVVSNAHRASPGSSRLDQRTHM